MNTCLLSWINDVPQHRQLIGELQSWWNDYRAVPHDLLSSTTILQQYSYNFAKEISDQSDVPLLVDGLKRFLGSDVEKARLIAKWAVSRFPESKELVKIANLLSPSKVVTDHASGFSRKLDFEWIRSNHKYHRGQWVAVSEGRCLASGKNLKEVRENARKQVALKKVLLTYLPSKGGV